MGIKSWTLTIVLLLTIQLAGLSYVHANFEKAGLDWTDYDFVKIFAGMGISSWGRSLGLSHAQSVELAAWAVTGKETFDALTGNKFDFADYGKVVFGALITQVTYDTVIFTYNGTIYIVGKVISF